jgi:tyrosine decarboxylase/aspartate 1-decarboxylase
LFGRPASELVEELKARVAQLDRYQDHRILGFPGTAPEPVALKAQALFSKYNPNNIGTHTHGDGTDGEKGAFEASQQLEREVIYTLGSLLGGYAVRPVDEAIDGYLTSGATEANEMGLWIGRNKLCPELGARGAKERDRLGRKALLDERICVIAPASAHYSIRKACNKLGLGEGTWSPCARGKDCATRALLHAEGGQAALVPHRFRPNPDGSGLVLASLDERGRVDVRDVEARIDRALALGVRKFILVATAGTTMTGAFDPVADLAALAERKEREVPGAQFYLHVDAAFGGLVAPFLPEAERPVFDFRVPRVDSLAVDMHKMGMVPYPGGVFLCRKGLQRHVQRAVAYVAGHSDDTILGSRPGTAAATCWAVLSHLGRNGFERIIGRCIRNTRYLERKLVQAGATTVTPPMINILAAEFDARRFRPERVREIAWCGKPGESFRVVPELFCRDASQCPRRVYRFTVMPHVLRRTIDDFIGALNEARVSG